MQERVLEEKQGSWWTPEAYLEATEVFFFPQGLGASHHAVRSGHEGEVHGLWAHFGLIVVAKAKEDNYSRYTMRRATKNA